MQGSVKMLVLIKSLLFHTEVRWLSRRNVTRRAFELKERNDLLTFFKEKNHNFKDDLENDEFILQLAYLSDISQACNLINLLLQRENSNVTVAISKLEPFTRKFDISTKIVERKQYGMLKLFFFLQVELTHRLSQKTGGHFKQLRTELVY